MYCRWLVKLINFAAASGIYLVLFLSIFDVYYTSPLTKGLKPTPVDINPSVSHLIFIVADGLRADKLFTNQMNDTPFIKNLLLQHAAWGLSHTRVPTESRPGHIAMLGGFYEDVASITKGWQANAVEFDSLFNRTLRGWAWGTPEVVQLFSHDRPDFVKIENSPKELNDLTLHNLTELDVWTVDRFLESLKDNKSGFFASTPATSSDGDPTRRGHLAFLHLDAADHIGHSFKPGSTEYQEMVRNLDRLISRVVQAVAQTQGSNRVAFVLTADHGMTDWGSHGSGSLHETVTPLLVWGPGLAGPEPLTAPVQSEGTDQYGLPLHNYGRRRRELKQADLCPLMAGLLGVPIPSNSVGRVPLHFLALNDSDRAHLVRSNCIQILNQLREKQNEKKSYRIFFKQYKPLTTSKINRRVNSANILLNQGKFPEAIAQYEILTDLALEALNYYHKYDRPFLGFCIAAIFGLWSLVILSTLVGPVQCTKQPETGCGRAQCVFVWLSGFLGILLICFVTAFSYSQPCTHTLYQLVPLLLFLYLTCSTERRNRLSLLCGRLGSGLCGSGSRMMYLVGLVVLILLELIIWGFLYRPLLSLACVLVAMWPLFDHSFGASRKHLRRLWYLACLTLSIFPLLPVIGSTFNPLLVCISGLIIAVLNYAFFPRLSAFKRASVGSYSRERISFVGLLMSFAIAMTGTLVCIMHSGWTFTASLQTPIHVFSWSTLVVLPLVVLIFVPPRLGLRALAWIGVFVTPLLLLSTHYEGMFILVFITVGLLWIQLETMKADSATVWSINTLLESDHTAVVHKLTNSTTSPADLLTIHNFRQSVIFIFLLVISFFGTGNIASLNSFDPRSTFCFITSLKPAIMGFLLLVKVLCPMICLGVIYAAVQLASGRMKLDTPLYAHTQDVVSAQTGLSAVMSNFIAVHFFAWLRDEGSWLEIGNSISHYVIAMALGFAAFLFARLGRKMLTCHLAWISGYSEPEWRKHV